MTFGSIQATSLNAEIIEGILTLIPKAEIALKENNYQKFLDISDTIRTCSEHTYTSLQKEISDSIFDVSWDIGILEDANSQDVIFLAERWAKNITTACKQHLI